MGDNTTKLDLKTMQQITMCGYQPIGKKGKGTYGFVYEVGDNNGQSFAFKYILPDEYYQDEGLDCLPEIDILTRVHHPHIIHADRILTTQNCEIDGIAIVLPLADRTLFDVIRDQTMITAKKLPILYKLATALEFLHRSNILHLDIKATNVVMIGDTPYFIDFGLSTFVDNVTVGKYDPRVKITIDYRPPEILAGGRTYNAASDIWSFGIMMLYTLGGRNIYNLYWGTATDDIVHKLALKNFTNPNTIPAILSDVDPKYRDGCIDLASKMLQVDPTKRITALEIVNHPVFDEFRVPIDGRLEVPKIPYDYAPDHRDIIKLMIHWALSIYQDSHASILFLAVDLFARASSYYKEKTPQERITLAATCLWIAAKLINPIIIPIKTYVSKVIELAPHITGKMILETEIELIHLLSGILYVSNLYSKCTNGDQLRLSYDNIIIARDSTLYARTDVPAWINVMNQLITTPTYPTKEIMIKELVA